MFEFENIATYISPLILVGCLCLGHMIKSMEFIPNRFIPLILGCTGAVLGSLSISPFAVESVIYGCLSGLASTGMYETFRNFIERKK